MSTFEFYLLLLLPSIGHTLGVLAFLSGFGLIISTVAWIVSNLENLGEACVSMWKRLFKIAACVFVPTVILATLMPSETQMGMLIAYELGSNVDGLTELPADVVEYLRALLDSVTGELASQVPDSN